MEPKPRAVRGPGPRDLVVEDNEQVAYLLDFLLERAGYEVVTATNGREAERLLDGDLALDVILLDLISPHMDGFQLLMQVRENPQRASAPVMILSGKSIESDIVRAFELGADDYVTKPFRPAELIARVRRRFSRRRSTAARTILPCDSISRACSAGRATTRPPRPSTTRS